MTKSNAKTNRDVAAGLLTTPKTGCPECEDMTSLDISFNMLTGHSTQCPKVTALSVFRQSRLLIYDLVRTVESLAKTDDEIPANARESYRKAKAIISEFRPREVDESSTHRHGRRLRHR